MYNWFETTYTDTYAADRQGVCFGGAQGVSTTFASGYLSGRRGGRHSICIGDQAAGGTVNAALSGESAIAIGYKAANAGTGLQGVAIGHEVVSSGQTGHVGIGKSNKGGGAYGVSLGWEAGGNEGANENISIGKWSTGNLNSHGGKIFSQNIAIGSQSMRVQAYGFLNNIAIGNQTMMAAANPTEEANEDGAAGNSVVIGNNAGKMYCANWRVALGAFAASTNPSGSSAIGREAIAIGGYSGNWHQGNKAVSLGFQSGQSNQGTRSLAIGYDAGRNKQITDAVAIGSFSGASGQQKNSVAIGLRSGQSFQLENSVAIGSSAGLSGQGKQAVAIGVAAGQLGQGDHAIAIGNLAGQLFQHENSICINTDSTPLSSTNAGFYVAPIQSGGSGQVLYYDATTKEIKYGAASGGSDPNVGKCKYRFN